MDFEKEYVNPDDDDDDSNIRNTRSKSEHKDIKEEINSESDEY